MRIVRIIDRWVGAWLHARIVRVPLAHAALLNQYRSSEDFGKRYPHSVCDRLLADGPLKAKYRKHQADELRHDRQYSAAIRRLGGEPAPVRPERDYMLAVWREACVAGVGVPYARFREDRPLDHDELMRLWALQTAVEERGLVEIALHRAACGAVPAVLEALDAIEPDERHHVEYSERALRSEAGAYCQSLDEGGAEEGESLLRVMRGVEERAYRRVTGAFLRDLLAGPLAGAGPGTRTALRAICATMPAGPAPLSTAWEAHA